MKKIIFLNIISLLTQSLFSQTLKGSSPDKVINSVVAPVKIHLIIFTDTQSLKCGVKDKALILDWINKIVFYTGAPVISYNPTSFYSEKAAKNILNNIFPTKNDVVIFYYSGHGFRYKKQSGNYPYLSFCEKNSIENRLSLKYIHDRLKNKKARLTITIGDLCNAEIPYELPFEHRGLPIADAYRKLFLNAKGNFIVASSKPFQTSVGYPSYGSLFTINFLNTFTKTVEVARSPDWNNILQGSQIQTENGTKSQNTQVPIYECSIKYN